MIINQTPKNMRLISQEKKRNVIVIAFLMKMKKWNALRSPKSFVSKLTYFDIFKMTMLELDLFVLRGGRYS